jgi:phage terminase large subunit
MATVSKRPEITVNLPIQVYLPCYHHLLINEIPNPVDGLAPIHIDIDFLWGGRDSGKSRDIAQRLLVACMNLPYFRCVLIRKVANTIKDSQWQLLKDVAEEWKIDHLFRFLQSPLEIHCINGNKFICRGMDEPGKLKSVSNPSHCWAEEGNQLDKDDFIIIMTSLRYNSGRVKVWFSFNPECDGDFEEYWLYEIFFKPYKKYLYKQRVFIAQWQIEVPGAFGKKQTIAFTYRSTWTTYHDNPYCKPERVAFLEQLAILEPYWYEVFTRGYWGNRKVNDPYCHCFNEQKHVGHVGKPIPNLELYLSFDFNVNPITCGVYQHDIFDNWIRCIESIKLDQSDIYKLCDYILAKYGGYVLIVTGDATGRNTTALVQDGINYYTVIKNQLQLADGQMRQPTINPPVKENRVLVNACLYKLDIVMDTNNCKELIFDCKKVSVTNTGDIDKGSRSDPVKRADHLDHFRYYLNTFHKRVLKMQ